jgi:predicted membrane-bound mannosyltransferase
MKSIEWTEGVIVPLGIIGFIAAVTGWGVKKERRDFSLFIAAFSLFVLIVYSAISYKTPWCLLTFIMGLILLAGIGFGAIVRLFRYNPAIFILLAVALAFPLTQLKAQAFRLNSKLATYPKNPYVYSGSLGNVNDIQKYLEKLAKIKPEMKVFMENTDAWPLAWYVRRVPVTYFELIQNPRETADVYLLLNINHKESPVKIAGYVESANSLRTRVSVLIYTRQALYDKFVEVETARMQERQ